MKLWMGIALLLSCSIGAEAQVHHYDKGVLFPRPTTRQFDSLQTIGALPIWLHDSRYLPFYWPRISLMAVGRLSERTFNTPSIDGGDGGEITLAIPLLQADYGIFFYGRGNRFRLNDSGLKDWNGTPGTTGIVYGAGLGAAFSLPFRSPRLSLPATLGFGVATFRQNGRSVSDPYVTIEIGAGIRYRLGQKFSLQAQVQPAWFAPLGNAPGILSWNLSFGLEVALSIDRDLPLQLWVPPLVLGAQDVVQLLQAEPTTPLNWFDRHIDFINTQLKPLTAYRWYDLGYRGIVRGTVIATSRASSGNITAVDVRIDSADRRGFRVWRTALLLDSTRALRYLLARNTGDTTTDRLERIVNERIHKGDYAYRPREAMGVRYLRAELFPQSKGPLDRVPQVGSRVEIVGNIYWDGDGHIEIHPRTPDDIRLIKGKFLDSDDEGDVE